MHFRSKYIEANDCHIVPDSADTTQRYGSLKGCLKKYQKARGILAQIVSLVERASSWGMLFGPTAFYGTERTYYFV